MILLMGSLFLDILSLNLLFLSNLSPILCRKEFSLSSSRTLEFLSTTNLLSRHMNFHSIAMEIHIKESHKMSNVKNLCSESTTQNHRFSPSQNSALCSMASSLDELSYYNAIKPNLHKYL